MTDQTNLNKNWLENEAEQFGTTPTGERLPSLKLETNKAVKFSIDFTNPFQSWTKDGTTKKIIPVMHKNEKKNLWLNVKNPLYRELIERGKKGQKEFTVSTTGTQKETRYTIIDED